VLRDWGRAGSVGGGHFERKEKSHFMKTFAMWLDKCYDTVESQIIELAPRKSNYRKVKCS